MTSAGKDRRARRIGSSPSSSSSNLLINAPPPTTGASSMTTITTTGAGKNNKRRLLGVPLLIAVLFVLALFFSFFYLSDNYYYYYDPGGGSSSVSLVVRRTGPSSSDHRAQSSSKGLNPIIADHLPLSVTSWLRACRNVLSSSSSSLPLVFYEPDVLGRILLANRSSSDGNYSVRGRLPFYRFAIPNGKDSRRVLSKLLTCSAGMGWWKVGSSSITALSDGNTILILSLMEIRPNYVYVRGTSAATNDGLVQEPARAFMGINFTSSTINVTADGSVKLARPEPFDAFLWQWPRSIFLECNRTSASYLRAHYPPAYSGPPKIADDFVQVLADFRDVLVNRRVTPLLCGGTALGWYRECGIIPDTTDMDLMFPASEWVPELERDLSTHHNFSLYWVLGKPKDSYELSVYSNGIKIDLFSIYEEGNRSWVGGMMVSKREKLRWWYPRYERACSVDLKGHLFYVPCDVVSFLEADYGPAWYTPHRTADFVWYSSHKNVQRVGQWPADQWKRVYRTFNT